MKLGDGVGMFEKLERHNMSYRKESFTQLCTQSSVLVAIACRAKGLKCHVNKNISVYRIKYCCIHGGRMHKNCRKGAWKTRHDHVCLDSTCNGYIRNLACRVLFLISARVKDCPFQTDCRVLSDGKSIEVVVMTEEHNKCNVSEMCQGLLIGAQEMKQSMRRCPEYTGVDGTCKLLAIRTPVFVIHNVDGNNSMRCPHWA